MAARNIYDWNQIRAALRLMQEVFPGFLENVVLIGGGACWFYREAGRASFACHWASRFSRNCLAAR